MRKVGFIILALAGVVTGVYLYEQYSLVKKFTYSITGIVPKNISATSINFLAGFTVTNQSDLSAHITNVNIKAYLNNILVGTITNNLDIIIPAHGTGNVQVVLTVLNQSIAKNITDVLTSIKNFSDTGIDLVGNIQVQTMLAKVPIPVKYSTTGKDLTALYKENFG